MQTKRTRYNVVGSGILHLLMHSAVAAVSVWGRGREPLAVRVCVGKGGGDPWRCLCGEGGGDPWWCLCGGEGGPLAVSCEHKIRKFFVPLYSSQPPLSQNSNLNRFSCYFLCSIWKVWGLSELLLTCEQILMASCEHTRTLSSFSRAGIVWTQAQITPSLPIHRPWIWLSWCNFCFFTSVVVIGFNPNTVKLSEFFGKGLWPVTIIGMTKLCKGCLYGRRDGIDCSRKFDWFLLGIFYVAWLG